MRLCLLSDLPWRAAPGDETGSDAEILGHHTLAWAQQGHDVYWLVPPAILHTPSVRAVVTPATDDLVPATCRHVIPLQAYWYADVRLLCVPPELWQRHDLHTRLFTLLCLLHRARPCTLFHAWSTVPIAYLTVYTARYLARPAVLSCAAQPDPQDDFLWAWATQHATACVVHNPSVPLALEPGRMHNLDPAHPDATRTLLALYRRLSTPAS